MSGTEELVHGTALAKEVESLRPSALAAPAAGGGGSADGAAAPVRSAPRVLMIVESSGGGTGRHVLDLSSGLQRRGCEVHVVYSPRRADRMFLDRLATLDGVRAHAIEMRTGIHRSDLRAAQALRRYARAHGPFDVIHGHSSKGGAQARLAGVGSGAAVFYTLHGLIMMDPGLARWKRAFYLGIELLLSRCTDRIIAVSPEEARAAAGMGFGQSRVITVPNGVETAEPSAAQRAEARRALGLAADDVAIGFVGRLVDQKAPHVLIEGFAKAAADVPHARLVVVGDGPLRPEMESLAARLNLHAAQILWLGERDARGVYPALDAFALSSRKEGLPYVVLEAMAAGLPVVATKSSGVEILIEPGVNGHVVPTDDAPAFGRALIDVAKDAARRRAMGAASLRRARGLDVETMVERTLNAYLEHQFA